MLRRLSMTYFYIAAAIRGSPHFARDDTHFAFGVALTGNILRFLLTYSENQYIITNILINIKGGIFLDKFFRLAEHGTNKKTEIIAGLTTFMAMAYILMVNPGMFADLGTVSFGAIYIATALSAVVGTLLIGSSHLLRAVRISSSAVLLFITGRSVLVSQGRATNTRKPLAASQWQGA